MLMDELQSLLDFATSIKSGQEPSYARKSAVPASKQSQCSEFLSENGEKYSEKRQVRSTFKLTLKATFMTDYRLRFRCRSIEDEQYKGANLLQMACQ